jgi:hypothetical protein
MSDLLTELVQNHEARIRRESAKDEADRTISAMREYRSRLSLGDRLWHYLELAVWDAPHDGMLERIATPYWEHPDERVGAIWRMITDPRNEEALRTRCGSIANMNHPAAFAHKKAWEELRTRKAKPGATDEADAAGDSEGREERYRE